MSIGNLNKSCIFALLASLLGACASQPRTVPTSLQREIKEPALQPEMVPAVTDPEYETRPEPASKPSPYAREDVVWIQQRLQELGYYTGAVDGSAGQATRNAIEAYQQDQGVAPDGKPTAELRDFMWRNGG